MTVPEKIVVRMVVIDPLTAPAAPAMPLPVAATLAGDVGLGDGATDLVFPLPPAPAFVAAGAAVCV